MVSQGAPQQGPPQQPSEGGGIDPQQVMQEVAQMLQQGAQPEQIMQQLVQEGIPQDVAQQIIQQVMQQMQGGQYQQAAPQQSQMAYGGTYSKGGEYNMSHEQVQDLINKGYKIEYL
jgi:SOS response regulatory protein OraA/RecX